MRHEGCGSDIDLDDSVHVFHGSVPVSFAAAHPGIVHQDENIVVLIHSPGKIQQGRLVGNIELKTVTFSSGITTGLTYILQTFSRQGRKQGVYSSACKLQGDTPAQTRTCSRNYCKS